MSELKIFKCDNYGNPDEANFVELQISPSEINIDFKNIYADNKTLGAIGSDQKFVRSDPTTLTLKTLFDSTGAISSLDIKEKIEDLKRICYSYNGSEHQPNKNIIIWGDILFKCCLTKFIIVNKLFTPEGELLRVEVELSFAQYMDKNEEARIKNQQSPDITHYKEIHAGDNLPSLCKKVYNSQTLYSIVANINNLTDFRNVKQGTKLIFPPLK
ncbi:MAG: hypothetical protein JW915_21335 [Chitinispirillaceae bacterium]|nr:hypothetical protein [Chitinispirillaceae bacterium]